MLDLPNELPSVGNYDHLNLRNLWINLENRWNAEGQSLAAAVDGLEYEVLVWLVKELWYSSSLDDGRSVHSQVMQIVSELLWDLKVVPGFLLGAEVDDLVFVLYLELAFDELSLVHLHITFAIALAIIGLRVKDLELVLGHLLLAVKWLFLERLHFEVKVFEFNYL